MLKKKNRVHALWLVDPHRGHFFQRCLKISEATMGFGSPDQNLDAPNEKFDIPNFYRGIEAVGET